MRMFAWIQGVAGMLMVCGVSAQVVLPASPRNMVNRPTGGGGIGGVSIVTPDSHDAPAVRHITHLVLSESRVWTSSEGQTLQAKLLAFEDVVVEAPKGAQPAAPAPPANISVIRAGKIRLISDKKPFELALDRLSQADREFVERISAAHPTKSAATPP